MGAEVETAAAELATVREELRARLSALRRCFHEEFLMVCRRNEDKFVRIPSGRARGAQAPTKLLAGIPTVQIKWQQGARDKCFEKTHKADGKLVA